MRDTKSVEQEMLDAYLSSLQDEIETLYLSDRVISMILQKKDARDVDLKVIKAPALF